METYVIWVFDNIPCMNLVKTWGHKYRNIVDQMTQHDDRVVFGYVLL